MKPIVTVLVDTYNHERFIERALASVLDQDFPASEMEILVVDDGSTDRTPELVRRFEPRVRLIRKENGGQASAFNAGIPETRGEIVAFLDGDDWWHPQKLSRVVQKMFEEPAVGIVGNGIVMVRSDASGKAEILKEGFRFRANTLTGVRLFRLRKSLLGTSRMTIRKTVLNRIGPVPKELVVEADEYLFTLAAVLGDVEIVPEALTFYRLHDSNGFQFSRGDPARRQRKRMVLSALLTELSKALDATGIDSKVRRALIELTEAESNQLGLMLDGGWPWQTVKTEWNLYRALSPDSSVPHRVFKLSTLMVALLIPPKLFYRARAAAAQSQAYATVRRVLFPRDNPRHVRYVSDSGAVL